MDPKMHDQSPSAVNPRPWKLIVVMFLVTGIVALSLYHLSNAYVIGRAEKNIQNLLLSNQSIHHYIQKDVRQTFDKLRADGMIQKDLFIPEVMSSSYILRKIHRYYNEERRHRGFSEFYFKLAAINPRNPVNTADNREKKLIHMFNTNKYVKAYHKTIEINGKKYLYYAIPFM
ncbi:MAG: DUF3365 domain-containing protein, partial [Desulfobacterales bacterium]